jgi:hypothetical protein
VPGKLTHFFFLIHLNFLTLANGISIGFSGGGGVMLALGGTHPCLRQMACTSDPLLHLNSAVGVLG